MCDDIDDARRGDEGFVATRGRRASPDVPRGVARAQCVARDASRRDSRAHARGDARARGGRSPPPPARTPRRRPRPRAPSSRAADPPLRRPVYDTLSLETRDALATAAALAQRAARAGEAVNALLSDVGATLADELLWMSDQDAGPFGVVYAPLPDDADRNPLRRRRPKTSSPSSLTSSSPSPLRFPRARTPRRVPSRRHLLLARVTPPTRTARVPRVGALVYRPVGAAARASAPFPVVAFGVGWNSWTERYDRTLTHLASHGFVVVSPTVADRRPTPRPSASSPTTSTRVSIGPRARHVDRAHPVRSDRSIPTRTVRSFQRRGRGGARRDGRDARGGPGPGPGPSALAGVGAFSASAGVDLDALSAIRDVAVFQVAGQRDSHVTPRAVARLADAMARASPRVVAVVRGGSTVSSTRRRRARTLRRSATPRGRGRAWAGGGCSRPRRRCASPGNTSRRSSRGFSGGTRRSRRRGAGKSFPSRTRTTARGARGRLGSGKTRGSWWNRKRRCGGGGEGGDAASGSEDVARGDIHEGRRIKREGGSGGMREVLVPKKKRSCRP